MRDFLSIGSSPLDEPCVQVGEPDYYEKMKAEGRRFIALLRKKFGPEPYGAHLAIKSFPHDFGTYHEVVCYYETDIPEAAEYAFRCEAETPLTWEG